MHDVLSERDIPPWRRRSNAWRCVASVLVAGLVASLGHAGLGLYAQNEPEPKWTIDVPEHFGEPILAQLSSDHIAVTSQNGVTTLDARDGKRLWEHELPTESLETRGGRLNFATAPVTTPIVGDMLLVTEFEQSESMISEALPSKITALDLHTGQERFSITPAAGRQMDGSVTRSTIAVRECGEPYEPSCSLTGYDLANGQPRWNLDREFRQEDLSFPAPLRSSIQHGQSELPSRVLDPTVVPSEAHAVIEEHDSERSDPEQLVHAVTTIDLDTGETGAWNDSADSHETAASYTPMNNWLLRSDPTSLSLVDPQTGDARHDLPLLGSYATDSTNLTAQPAVLVDGEKLLDIEAVYDGATIDEVQSYQILDPETGEAVSEHALDGPLVGANDGTMVTVSDADENPVLSGIDVDTAKQSWSKRLYPESAEASGLRTKAVLMREGMLAMTSTPHFWQSDYLEGAAQTRLVRLSDGHTDVIDNVSALGLGNGGLLGFVHPSEDDDTPAQLAYYPTQR